MHRRYGVQRERVEAPKPPPSARAGLDAHPGGLRHLRRMASPRLELIYCRQCRWLLRASWIAQELLTTFDCDLGEVALVPGEAGAFDVRLDGELLFSRAQQGRFPEAKELKQLIRDRLAPGRDLGHSDR